MEVFKWGEQQLLHKLGRWISLSHYSFLQGAEVDRHGVFFPSQHNFGKLGQAERYWLAERHQETSIVQLSSGSGYFKFQSVLYCLYLVMGSRPVFHRYTACSTQHRNQTWDVSYLLHKQRILFRFLAGTPIFSYSCSHFHPYSFRRSYHQ